MALGDLSWDETDRAWGDASAIYSESRPVAILGDRFFQFDSGSNFQAGPVQVSLTRTGLTITGQDRFGQWTIDPGLIKEILGMWPVFKGVTGTIVQLWVGSQDSPGEEITFEGPYDFRIGIDDFQDFNKSGRYMAVRFTSSGQPPWELLSYDVDLEPVGER
jgi:hypothetical protein